MRSIETIRTHVLQTYVHSLYLMDKLYSTLKKRI